MERPIQPVLDGRDYRPDLVEEDYAKLAKYADAMDTWLREEVLPVLRSSEAVWEGRPEDISNAYSLKLHALIATLESDQTPEPFRGGSE